MQRVFGKGGYCGHLRVGAEAFAYHGRVSSFAERLRSVEERIEVACRRAGRAREDVRLMGVSKMHPAETLAEAVCAGLTLFGENRGQEFENTR